MKQDNIIIKQLMRKMFAMLVLAAAMLCAMPVNARAAAKLAVTASPVEVNGRKMTLYAGQSSRISITYKGEHLEARKAKLKSSRKKVATISKDGVIRAKKKGTASITVKYRKKSFKIKVTVKNAPEGFTGTEGNTQTTPAPETQTSVTHPLTSLTVVNPGGECWTGCPIGILAKGDWMNYDNLLPVFYSISYPMHIRQNFGDIQEGKKGQDFFAVCIKTPGTHRITCTEKATGRQWSVTVHVKDTAAAEKAAIGSVLKWAKDYAADDRNWKEWQKDYTTNQKIWYAIGKWMENNTGYHQWVNVTGTYPNGRFQYGFRDFYIPWFYHPLYKKDGQLGRTVTCINTAYISLKLVTAAGFTGKVVTNTGQVKWCCQGHTWMEGTVDGKKMAIDPTKNSNHNRVTYPMLA